MKCSNCLPDGGYLTATDLSRLPASSAAPSIGPPEILFRRDAAAGELWRDCYPSLSQLRPGMRGAATSRAEAQVMRLSAIYAALDSTSVIALPHLSIGLFALLALFTHFFLTLWNPSLRS